MFRHFFYVRWCMDMFNFQIEVKILAPNSCLKVEQACSLKRHGHVRHHRNKVVRVGRRLAEAVVVVMIAQHADSLATALAAKNVFNATSIYVKVNLLLAVRIFHIPVRATDGNTSVASPQVRANIVSVTTHSRCLLAFINILMRKSTSSFLVYSKF